MTLANTIADALQYVERFDRSGAIIVQGTSGVNSGSNVGGASVNDVDASGRQVATATGYTYTNPTSSPINRAADIDVGSPTVFAGIQVPQGCLVLLDFAQVRGGSELSSQMLRFALAIGDTADRAGSKDTVALQALTRPFDRDGRIKLWRWVKGDKYVRISVTNDDAEAPHLAEGRLTGWLIKNALMTPSAFNDVVRTLLGGASS